MRFFRAAAIVFCIVPMLGGCSPFASVVADHWPHWAGGLPEGTPPRPGTPGYEEFIAHGQPIQAPGPTAPDASQARPPERPVGPEQTAVGTVSPPVAEPRRSVAPEQNAAPGGLY